MIRATTENDRNNLFKHFFDLYIELLVWSISHLLTRTGRGIRAILQPASRRPVMSSFFILVIRTRRRPHLSSSQNCSIWTSSFGEGKSRNTCAVERASERARRKAVRHSADCSQQAAACRSLNTGAPASFASCRKIRGAPRGLGNSPAHTRLRV